MDVRLKIGRYAGEIRDIPAIEAKLMLADGRAEDPQVELEEPAPDAPEQHKPKKKR